MPPATRPTSPGWKDPRLWIGVALVAGSVVAGSQVLASADDSTAVWAASHELVAGQVVGPDDLVAVRVRFVDERDSEHYLEIAEEFPEDVTLTRGIGAGELLAESALGDDAASGVVSVALALPPEEVPRGLGAGSHVDVWVLGEGREGRTRATVALEDVAVLAAPRTAGSFGSTGGQQVVLAVPEDESDALAKVLAASGQGEVRLVGRGPQ